MRRQRRITRFKPGSLSTRTTSRNRSAPSPTKCASTERHGTRCRPTSPLQRTEYTRSRLSTTRSARLATAIRSSTTSPSPPTPTLISKSRSAIRISERIRCGRRSSSVTTKATSSRKASTTSSSTARTIPPAARWTTARLHRSTATAMSRRRGSGDTTASRARTSASERPST